MSTRRRRLQAAHISPAFTSIVCSKAKMKYRGRLLTRLILEIDDKNGHRRVLFNGKHRYCLVSVLSSPPRISGPKKYWLVSLCVLISAQLIWIEEKVTQRRRGNRATWTKTTVQSALLKEDWTRTYVMRMVWDSVSYTSKRLLRRSLSFRAKGVFMA